MITAVFLLKDQGKILQGLAACKLFFIKATGLNLLVFCNIPR